MGLLAGQDGSHHGVVNRMGRSRPVMLRLLQIWRYHRPYRPRER